jgi:hypothetical protein
VLDVSGTFDVALPIDLGMREALPTMQALSRWATGGQIEVRSAGDHEFVIHLGAALGLPGANVYAFGAGWKAWVGNRPPTFDIDDAPGLCFGPYFAACMAVGEVFKTSRRLRKGIFADSKSLSLWSGATGNWDDLVDGPSVVGVTLSPFYLIGAGAVGQGVIQVLGACGVGTEFVVTIDADTHDEKGTNLNRCFLAGIKDLGNPKVDVVTRYRLLTGINGMEFRGTLRDYVQAPVDPRLPEGLKVTQSRDAFEVIVSAVDLNTSRHDIQGLSPVLVIGGSSDGLRAQSNVYRRTGDAECLACWNEPEVGKKPSATCGNMSAVDLGEPVDTPEFSVSFVSMAAAVFATCRLIIETSGLEHTQRLERTVFQFKNLVLDEGTTSANPTCAYCQLDPSPQKPRHDMRTSNPA